MERFKIIPRVLIATTFLLNSCTPVAPRKDPSKEASKNFSHPAQTFSTDIKESHIQLPLAKILEIKSNLPDRPSFFGSQYLADNEAEATMVAHSLGVESPSNMCGDLAIRILKDMGVIPQTVSDNALHTADPVKQWNRFLKVFPESEFEVIHIKTPAARYDFANNPLLPGDFIFLTGALYRGFGHMIAITEDDSSGHAYTVTNIWKKDGTTIRKIMVEDLNIPYDPNASLYYDPTKPDEPFFNNGWKRGSPYGETALNMYIFRRKLP